MRLLSILLVLVMLAGCAARTYRSDTKPVDHFDLDLAACGGSTTTGPLLIFPLILLPLVVATSIIVSEVERDCMAQRGWQLAEPAAPPTSPLEPERAVLH